jgi:hypothetical protein
MIIKPERVIPEVLQKQDPRWENHARHLADIYHHDLELAKQMLRYYEPWRTRYPSFLARMVGAYLSRDDDERTIRQKAGNAINFHRNHTIFKKTWKPTIDGITGRSSQIWRRLWYSGGFVIGEDKIGLERIGGNPSQISLWQPGIVLIDCGGGSAPSDEEVRLIKNQFGQVKTVYMRFFLGHVEEDFITPYYNEPDYNSPDYVTDSDVFIIKAEFT